MPNRNTMRNSCVLIVLGVYLLVEKRASACRISGQLAFCDFLFLRHVPALPSYVTRVSLSNNYIGEVNETSFDGLEQLEVLYLGSQLTKTLIVKNNAFRQLSNLTYLYLGGNKALILEPDAFVGLTHLRNLVLLYNGLDESILKGKYLQPLVSLETLDLYGNEIKRIQPGLFFRNMTKFHELNMTLNRADSVCEQDLLGFQGKHFSLLKLSSTSLIGMTSDGFDWKKCGNPFRNISFRVLDLSGNSFNEKSMRLFFNETQGTKIHHLILSSNPMGRSIGYNNLKDPDMQTFEGLRSSSVEILDLSRNFIFSLDSSVFSPLKEVKEIILSYNKINQIKRNAFLGLEHLQKLNLSNNLIGEIYPYTFENLPNVVEIDLSNNHIGAVVYKSFSMLPRLAILNLFGNAITALHTFATLSSLQVLQLGDNKLSSLYGLSAFANTSFIELSKNRLRDLKELYGILATLPDVQYISLRHNMLSVCYPVHSVPPQNNLTYLELQHNALQLIWASGACLDVFDNLGKLQYLSLSNNLLQSPLPNDIFKGLHSLKVMDLSSNFLTYLPHDIFPENLKGLYLSHNILGSPDPNAFHTISVINLGTNPCLCDCNLKDLLSKSHSESPCTKVT
ncbi:toll-like receptor 5 [Megalops cyprinoides]|uniref:toll-like receptor 5 n=1 Tax=Megalops cyprinoides TaxID=118141 RepID=UPI0018651D5D|nr:toll-like receptor 5 [Megalops cyprinoides]